MTIAIPLAVNVYMLALFMFLHGVAVTSIDSGNNVCITDIANTRGSEKGVKIIF